MQTDIVFTDQKFNIAKVSIFSKLICTFKASLTKIPVGHFIEIDKILKFIWKCKESGIAKILKKKKKVGGLELPEFQIFFFNWFHSMWDLSSLTIETWSLNHWTTRNVLPNLS